MKRRFVVLLMAMFSACGDDDAATDAAPSADAAIGDGALSDVSAGDSGSTDATAGNDVGPPVPDDPLPCEEEFTHRDHAGCESTIDGLRVKYFPLDAGVRVRHLVVHLHGDTANLWFSNGSFSRQILEWAKARDMLLLSALATSSHEGASTPAYGAAQPQQSDELITLLEHFRDAYGVASPERTYYWGVSGGAWFLSSQFISRTAHRMPGIYVANCGGSGESYTWQWDPDVDTEIRDSIAVYYNYGSEDFLADPSRGSHLDFEGRGITSDELIHEGAGHCDHPIAEPTIAFWERHL